MMDWRLGTMGFSYSEWAGTFYPKGLKASEWLAHYAKHFDAVELDTTFHAAPSAERVRRWADVTPDGFLFSVKTPRAVTHDAPIERGVGLMMNFLEAARELKQKLGVVLLQFAPSFTRSEFGKLDAFLSQMSADVRFAVEFRHPSWRTSETEGMLRERNVAWVSVDYEGEPAQVRPTTDFLYVRWIGAHDRFPHKEREQLDMSERLAWWKERIEEGATGVRRIFGFFNNDYAGYSVATCNRFKRMVGMEVKEDVEEGQGRLF